VSQRPRQLVLVAGFVLECMADFVGISRKYGGGFSNIQAVD
jgi:hypothetical protein